MNQVYNIYCDESGIGECMSLTIDLRTLRNGQYKDKDIVLSTKQCLNSDRNWLRN